MKSRQVYKFGGKRLADIYSDLLLVEKDNPDIKLLKSFGTEFVKVYGGNIGHVLQKNILNGRINHDHISQNRYVLNNQ